MDCIRSSRMFRVECSEAIILFIETIKRNYSLAKQYVSRFSNQLLVANSILETDVAKYEVIRKTKLYPTQRSMQIINICFLCVLFYSYKYLYTIEFQKTITEAKKTFDDNIKDNVQTKLKDLQNDIKTNKDDIKSDVDVNLQYLKYVTNYILIIF